MYLEGDGTPKPVSRCSMSANIRNGTLTAQRISKLVRHMVFVLSGRSISLAVDVSFDLTAALHAICRIQTFPARTIPSTKTSLNGKEQSSDL